MTIENTQSMKSMHVIRLWIDKVINSQAALKFFVWKRERKKAGKA